MSKTTANTNQKQKNSTLKTGERLITRIKLCADKMLEVNFKMSNEKETQEVSYKGKEEVMDKYVEQFNELDDVAKQIIPILNKADEDDLRVGIVRLSYNEKSNLERVSLSVQLRIDASNSPVNIATPTVNFVHEDIEETDFRITAENEEIIHKIIAMTKAYMDGDTRTKQLSLVKN